MSLVLFDSRFGDVVESSSSTSGTVSAASRKKKKSRKKSGSSTTIPVDPELPLNLGTTIGQKSAVVIPRDTVNDLMGLTYEEDPNEMHMTTPVIVDPARLALCFEHLSEGRALACLMRIHGELVQRGMVFTKNGQEVPLKPAMQKYSERVFEPMIFNAMLWMFACGLVPMTFIEDEQTGVVRPHIPEPNTCEIVGASVRGVAFWHARWCTSQNVGLTGSSGIVGQKFIQRKRDRTGRWQVSTIFDTINRATGNLDPKVIVLDGFGYNPCLLTGRLKSVMSAALKPSVRIRDFFLDTATVAESTNSAPPMVTRYNFEAENRNDKFRQGEWTGAGVTDSTGETQARRQNNSFLRNNSEVAALQSQMRLVSNTVNPNALAAFGINKSDLGGSVESRQINRLTGEDGECPQLWSKEWQVQSDRVIENAQLPNPRGDLIPLLGFANTETAELFGLSDNVFSANAPSSADAQTAKETKDVTISSFQRKLARVLTAAYDFVFMPNDVGQLMNEVRDIVRERRRLRDAEPTGYNNNGGDNPDIVPPSNSNKGSDNKFHRHNGVDYNSEEDDVEATRRREPTARDREAYRTGNNMIGRSKTRRNADDDDGEPIVEEPEDDFDEDVYQSLRGSRFSITIVFREEIMAEKVDLDEMYASGIIPWSSYTTSLAKLKRLDRSKLAKTDPLDKEARLATSLAGYLPYLQFKEQSKLARDQFKEQSKVNQQQIKQTKELAVLSSETTLAKPAAGAGGGGGAAKKKPAAKKKGKKKAAVDTKVDSDSSADSSVDDDESNKDDNDDDVVDDAPEERLEGDADATIETLAGRVESARKRNDESDDESDSEMMQAAEMFLALARKKRKTK
jgi:hypothetical protein